MLRKFVGIPYLGERITWTKTFKYVCMHFYVPLHVQDSSMFITHMHAILRSIIHVSASIHAAYNIYIYIYIHKIDRKCYVQSCVLMSLQSSQLSYQRWLIVRPLCAHMCITCVHACNHTHTSPYSILEKTKVQTHTFTKTSWIGQRYGAIHAHGFICMYDIQIKSWIGDVCCPWACG